VQPPVPARAAAPVTQGRAVVRKRASLAAQGEASPTEAWSDPFAQ
jgi:hypothetical protein